LHAAINGTGSRPAAAGTFVSLSVGDRVVYASHGIGLVESRQSGDGDLPESITLVFESGLRVSLPLARAGETLRPLASEPELDDVRRTLEADVAAPTEPWAKRQRSTQEKVVAGHVIGLAEVVRDSLRRELVAGGASVRALGPSERELYLRARKLLAAEIAACRGIEAAAADAWIVQHVGSEQPPLTDSNQNTS